MTYKTFEVKPREKREKDLGKRSKGKLALLLVPSLTSLFEANLPSNESCVCSGSRISAYCTTNNFKAELIGLRQEP